jgi:purine-binding chemotaxis protein CheW
VREIISLVQIAEVPLAPAYVRGVINLRGQVIFVVDLRRKLGMASDGDHDRKCIVVCDVMVESRPLAASLLVDGVCEVAQIARADIDLPPLLDAQTETPFLRGVAKVGGHVKFVLDVDALFGAGVLSLASLVKEA